MHAQSGGGRGVGGETLQGNYFQRNNAHLDANFSLFVLFPVWPGKTLKYLYVWDMGYFQAVFIQTVHFHYFR